MNRTNRKGLHRIKESSYASLRLTEIDSQRIIESFRTAQGLVLLLWSISRVFEVLPLLCNLHCDHVIIKSREVPIKQSLGTLPRILCLWIELSREHGHQTNMESEGINNKSPKTRRERTGSREVGGQHNKQHTAPRPRAPRAGNQRRPLTTGAQKKTKTKEKSKRKKTRTGRQQRKPRDTRGGEGGTATGREQPTARRETQIRRKRTASREAGGHQNKQHTAPRPRALRAGKQQKQETTGAHNENRASSGSDKNRETRKGGGGSNHQGNTNEAREHGEPRTGRPTKQTAHSAKAQGTRSRKPEKAKDNGGRTKKN